MSGCAAVTAVLGDTPYLVTLSDDLGHVWRADEPADLGGANVGPAPDRLMLGSLAFRPCTLDSPNSRDSLEAQCTTFEVAEVARLLMAGGQI